MPVDPKNRLNDLDSREWLQFQKSWFPDSENTLAEFIRFFTKSKHADGRLGNVGILPEQAERLSGAIHACGRQPTIIEEVAESNALDYVLIDWRNEHDTLQTYNDKGALRLAKLHAATRALQHRGHLTLLMRNATANATLLPIVWHFAMQVTGFLSQKDEKIGCEAAAKSEEAAGWKTDQRLYYCLNFRKGAETSSAPPAFRPLEVFHRHADLSEPRAPRRPAWSVVKPPPREKGVLLHPAKFPETLIARFIEDFSKPGEIVLDPMAGTGSALVAARQTGRRAAGIELNSAFLNIIRQRLGHDDLFGSDEAGDILIWGDATHEQAYAQLPPVIDYAVTSPPYWDMLRMKGAETQKKRRDAGLLVFYSDDPRDLGNLVDYGTFLAMLLRAYRLVITRLKPGGFMTVIVKNVKKRGKIYPLAWDLALALAPEMELRHEQIWCQDDQKLAPFGYRYAWVSNTFHHYCLHFRKPL